MNRTILSTGLMMLAAGSMSAQQLIFEDFESYDPGMYAAENIGPPWTTWSGTPDTEEDVLITEEEAWSGNNSIVFSSPDPIDGGPGDLVINLGNKTAGVFRFDWMMLIPSGHGGSFNIQHTEIPGEEWGVEVTFRANGEVEFLTDDANVTFGTFPPDEWFHAEVLVNHALDLGYFSINGLEPFAWPFSTTTSGEQGLNQLGAINFYAYAQGDPVLFYLDDVAFEDLTTVSIKEKTAEQVFVYPNPVRDILRVQMPGTTATHGALLDMTGRTVAEFPAIARQSADGVFQLDMGAHPSGVYFLRLFSGDQESVHRVVRE